MPNVVLSKALVAVVLMCLLLWTNIPKFQLSPEHGDRYQDTIVAGPGHMKKVFSVLLPTFFLMGLFKLWRNPHHGLRQPWSIEDVVVATVSILGFCLRLWAMQELGDLFTFEVGIRPEHELVTSGPYSVLRHPSYTGMLFGVFGFIMFLHDHRLAPVLFLALTAGLGWFVTRRIQNEEAMLADEFGEAWDNYCQVTWKLIPYVY